MAQKILQVTQNFRERGQDVYISEKRLDIDVSDQTNICQNCFDNIQWLTVISSTVIELEFQENKKKLWQKLCKYMHTCSFHIIIYTVL